MCITSSPRFSIVEVRRIGDAEPERVFRMLADAPIRILARAMQLTTGDESSWVHEAESDWSLAELGRRGWDWEDDEPGCDEPLGPGYRVTITGSEPAEVGDSTVLLLRCGAEHLPRFSWWDLATPIDPTLLQRDLDIEFGFVPRLVDPWRADGPAPGSPLADLCAHLPPIDRVALESHLEQQGLLHPAPLDAREATELTWAFAALGDTIGGGIPQGADGGLTAGFTEELAGTLGWEHMHTGALIDAAWRHRLMRRLHGRILTTNRGRLTSTRSKADIAMDAVGLSARDPWSGSRETGSALALLAIADGIGERLADVPSLFAEALSPLDAPRGTHPHAEFVGDRSRETLARDDLPDVLAGLALLSARGAHGVITPPMRRLANHLAVQPRRFSPF